MPTDDNPTEALEKQFDMEALSVSPVAKLVRRLLISLVFLPPPFDKVTELLTGYLEEDSKERIRLMLETVRGELCRQGDEIIALRHTKSKEESQAFAGTLRDLVIDAARKAQNTRAMERVKRIGLILANVAVEPKQPDADEAEEMMRIATELGDRDIEFLRELIRIEGDTLQSQDHIPRYDAHTRWPQGRWGDRVDPEIDSVFSKLESYGLVARLAPPNNLNVMADFQNRYVLLKKGLRFAALIHQGGLNPAA